MSANDRKHVFLVSCQRSGSTLSTLLVGAHSSCVSVGEAWKLDRPEYQEGSCTCGAQPISSCEFWSAVGNRLGEIDGIDPLEKPGQRPLFRTGLPKFHRMRLRALELAVLKAPTRSLSRMLLHVYAMDPSTRLLARNTERVLDAALDVSGASIVVESCKHPFRAWSAYLRRPETTQLLYVVRDGRGVMASFLGKGKVASQAECKSPEDAARRWVQENHEIQQLLAVVPKASQAMMRYESLCSDPATELTAVCSFLGVPYEPAMLSFRDMPNHNYSGNRMRHSGDSKMRVDENWRQVSTTDSLQTFDWIAGDLNRRLGYE